MIINNVLIEFNDCDGKEIYSQNNENENYGKTNKNHLEINVSEWLQTLTVFLKPFNWSSAGPRDIFSPFFLSKKNPNQIRKIPPKIQVEYGKFKFFCLGMSR